MITIELSFAIGLFILISFLLVFMLWIFYNYRESSTFNELKYLLQCPYCTYVFFNYKEKEMLVCPRCKSYISHSEGDQQNNNI